MKHYLTNFITVLILCVSSFSFAEEPYIKWNDIKIVVPVGYYVQYVNGSTITLYPKIKDRKVHTAIETNDISTKSSVVNSKGVLQNNCTVTFITDLKFEKFSAFKWETVCISLGTRRCITIPKKNCEICFYGNAEDFDSMENILKNIHFE